MEWTVIIGLAILVVVIAYALGTYVRSRPDLLTGIRPPLGETKASPAKGVNDREVRVVVNWLLSQAFEQTGVKVADDKLAYERIVEAANKAVRDLKSQDTVTVSLPFLTADASGPKHLEARMTREMIDELVKY